jgi:hypothetical protein
MERVKAFREYRPATVTFAGVLASVTGGGGDGAAGSSCRGARVDEEDEVAAGAGVFVYTEY